MTKVTPYFFFDGNCADAMKFYHYVFGGKLSIILVSESQMKEQFQPKLHGKVVNANLKSDNVDISASDWLAATRVRRPGNTVCAYITGASYEEINKYFTKLSEEADQTTLDELKEMPFGLYGALTDKYGVRWMFQGKPQIEQ